MFVVRCQDATTDDALKTLTFLCSFRIDVGKISRRADVEGDRWILDSGCDEDLAFPLVSARAQADATDTAEIP